jgi:hypothetical protein
MAALTDVTLTTGVPTAGTGTVSTLDKFNGTAGSSTTQVLTVQGVTSGTAMPVSLASVPSHAVTNAGTFAVQATLAAETTKVIGVVHVGDGTSSAAVKAASTAPAATDPALVVAISPNSVNANGRALPASSAPVVLNSMTYKAVAASASATLLGATGASGDYLDGVLIVPATAAAGVVSITDGGGSAITIFAGGGTTALPTLAPFFVPIGAISSGGAGGWKVTTGTNVSVIGVGNFT